MVKNLFVSNIMPIFAASKIICAVREDAAASAAIFVLST